MLLALTLAFATTPTSVEEVVGPPAVCHPFEIGQARSLPWKAGAFGYDPDFPLDKLNQELATLLDHQEDTGVQVESIRRAVVYAVGFGRTEELSLETRKLHTVDWDHDLGRHFGDGRDELKPALQWEGVDATMCLASALAIWISEPDEEVRDRLVLKAALMAGPDGGLATRNVLAIGDRFYGQEDYASLVHHLQKRVAAA